VRYSRVKDEEMLLALADDFSICRFIPVYHRSFSLLLLHLCQRCQDSLGLFLAQLASVCILCWVSSTGFQFCFFVQELKKAEIYRSLIAYDCYAFCIKYAEHAKSVLIIRIHMYLKM
jgi:hypothetical protein